MKRKVATGTIIALLMIGVGVICGIVINRNRQSEAQEIRKAEEAAPKSADDLPREGLGPVADFSLTESSGRTVTLADLRGRVWVAETFFTYCGAICPTMNRHFGDLHREFTGKEEPKFVSISVDPTRDKVPALADHARDQQADRDRWWFLTGDPKEIKKLTSSLMLPYEIGVPSSHSGNFMLVDRDGWVRGHYNGSDARGAEMPALRRDLGLLLAAPAKKN